MSLSITNIQQTEYDAFVKAAYQSAGKNLRATIRLRENVIGKTIDFRKKGSITAIKYGQQQAAIYQDINLAKETATLEKYRAPAAVDNISEFLVNIDEKRETAELGAMAVARRMDQIIIDTFIASGTANTIAEGATNLTYTKITTVNEFFSNLSIPKGNRHIGVSAAGEKSLLASNQFTSSDYNRLASLTDGTLDGIFFMGMNWHVIPTMTEGGLPKTGDIRSCFAWDKMSTGVGIGQDFTSAIERLPKEDSWQIDTKFLAGGTTVDAVGVIKIDIDETK